MGDRTNNCAKDFGKCCSVNTFIQGAQSMVFVQIGRGNLEPFAQTLGYFSIGLGLTRP
jgi:hypothetical protein